MAAVVKVEATKGTGGVIYCEVSGGESSERVCGTYEFKIGTIKSMICFLTVRRLAPCNIKLTAVSGNLVVEIDGKDKKVSRGNSVELSKRAQRVLVKERVK